MFNRKPPLLPDVGAAAIPETKELHELTYDELASQKIAIDQELARRGTGELEALKHKLVSIASALGVSMEDLFTQKKERKAREVKARYVNPDDHTQTWAGRGKPPKWMAEKLSNGAMKEEFELA